MNNYIIFTDSACDINPATLKEWGVESISMTFRFDGEEREYSSDDMEITDFYNRMRDGGVAKTAAINPDRFIEAFEEILKQGKDILYLGFSSGLSATHNNSRIAAEELRAKYPERKIITVDTLAASAGQGLLVYLTLEQKNNGATIEEAADFAEKTKLHICHWVTVDELVYLKRGGRISSTVAIVGKALGIKPIIHVDNDGKLISVSKVRGRKTSITTVANKYTELARNPKSGTVFISHGDCLEDAMEVADILKKEHKMPVKIVTHIGSVIGAHSGPGTIALFFVGKER